MINILKYSIILFLIILALTYYIKPNILINNSLSMISYYIIIVAIISFYIIILVNYYL